MGKKNEQRQGVYSTLDAYQAGFLKKRGLPYKLEDQGGKFVFVFESTDKLQRDLDEYHSGAMVEALGFAIAVKSLKTEIHSMRREKERVYGNGRYV